jgi:hypothetical protein
MTINIIPDGPPITLTASEADRLHREWQKCCQYTVNPPTFEEFVRTEKRRRDSPSSDTELVAPHRAREQLRQQITAEKKLNY